MKLFETHEYIQQCIQQGWAYVYTPRLEYEQFTLKYYARLNTTRLPRREKVRSIALIGRSGWCLWEKWT